MLTTELSVDGHFVQYLLAQKHRRVRYHPLELRRLFNHMYASCFQCDGFASFILPEVFDFLRTNKNFLDNLCKVIQEITAFIAILV